MHSDPRALEGGGVSKAMAWQSIESAPRDGMNVLAWSVEWSQPMMIAWGFNYRINCATWLDSDYEPCTPTHWLPIPEVPRVVATATINSGTPLADLYPDGILTTSSGRILTDPQADDPALD